MDYPAACFLRRHTGAVIRYEYFAVGAGPGAAVGFKGPNRQ